MNRRRKINYILVLVSITMVFVYSSFYIRNHELFNSPDETAQAYFIKQLSEGFVLASPITDFKDGSEYIVPRSIRVAGESLVPASFLGVIGIYGTVAYLFGIFSVYVFAGLVAVLGIIAFYKIILHVWGEEIAFPSLFLAFLFPGWWYYASLAFFPNILLVTLLLWSIYSYILYKSSGKYRYAYGSGIAIVLTLFVRLAAIPWIGMIWIALFVLDVVKKRREMLNFYIILFTVFFLLFLIPLVIIQKLLYGDIFETGYILAGANNDSGIIQAIFPGGFHPRVAWNNFWDYYVMLFWFIMIPSLVGLFYFCLHIRSVSVAQRNYIILFGAVSAWLVFYYGSWILTDNINNDSTIGVAYVRYWLPIYLFALPFSVLLYKKLVAKSSKKSSLLIGVFALLLYGTLSFQSVYGRFDDSLAAVELTLQQNIRIQQEVVSATKEDAIIVSSRHDKVFFPKRRVMNLPVDEESREILIKVLKENEVYWYTLMENDMIENEIVPVYAESGIMITNIITFEKGSLYVFSL